MILHSARMLNVAKVFATDGALYFRRKSKDTFTLPLYNTKGFFSVVLNESHTLNLTPIDITFKACSELVSVRDLLDVNCLLSKVFFTCYSDDDLLILQKRWKSVITLVSDNVSYQLNCKIYASKYEKFYNALVSGSKRCHYIVRVENVTINKRCSSA